MMDLVLCCLLSWCRLCRFDKVHGGPAKLLSCAYVGGGVVWLISLR